MGSDSQRDELELLWKSEEIEGRELASWGDKGGGSVFGGKWGCGRMMGEIVSCGLDS